VVSLIAHQKQYVLGPAPVSVRPDWIAVRISNGLFLSHCPKLLITRLRSRDGVDYVLLGLAVAADEPMKSVASGFHLRTSSDIEPWTGFWAGKWLLVSSECCLQDASGCLGVHYRRIGDDIWISNSPALLGSHLPNAPQSAKLPWRVIHNKGIDWIPAPFTTRDGVYKVLPLRTIDPRSGRMRPVRFARLDDDDASADHRLLASTLRIIMANWGQADFRDRYVALTAGLDTRTVLASAVASQIRVQAYTTHFPITLKRDLVLAPRVAACVGVAHMIRRPPSVDLTEVEARIAAISKHMDGANFHPATEYDDDLMNDSGITIAHGNCFEVGRCYYWTKFTNVGLIEPPTDPDQILAAFTFRSSWRPEPVELWRRALQSWIDSLSDHVPLALDWRDRFYLDQRLGSWNSAVQRASDVFNSTFFYPGNCLSIFNLLLQSDPARRKEGFAQREVIRLLAPHLPKIPFNPKPILRRLRETARDLLGPKAIHALKSLAPLSKSRRVP
jgi:hypothetical protein